MTGDPNAPVPSYFLQLADDPENVSDADFVELAAQAAAEERAGAAADARAEQQEAAESND